jgi:hypothetical protein
VRAIVLRKIPNAHASSAITGNDLTLVGVDHYVVDWRAVGIASLNRAASRFPDLDRAIFRTCDHPLSFTVECDACDVASVTFECKEGVWVCGFDVVKFDCVMTSGGEEAFVW